MACPGVQGGWSQALTWQWAAGLSLAPQADGEERLLISPAFSLPSGGALPAIIPFLAMTVTSIRTLG